VFGRRQRVHEKLEEIIQIFRSKGALSPQTGMTTKDLGLPPRFEEAMHRRLGRSGVFVQVDGKYYMSEQRLAEVKKMLEQQRNRSP
jgi:hypothetical protein